MNLFRLSSGTASDSRIRYDQNQIQRLESILNQGGWSLRQFRSLLDFGCGHGRLTQYLFQLAPGADIKGCDISARAVAQCRRNCPGGHFFVSAPRPPLPLGSEACDLIISYSVFTHLSESNHRDWLKELARILRPGGVMAHTTHSYEALRRIAMFSPERLGPYRLGRSVEEFIASRTGYHYVPTLPSEPEYGMTIISKEYVLSNWPSTSGLRVADYVEGAIEAFPEGCQDVVVLTKPKDTA